MQHSHLSFFAVKSKNGINSKTKGLYCNEIFHQEFDNMNNFQYLCMEI